MPVVVPESRPRARRHHDLHRAAHLAPQRPELRVGDGACGGPEVAGVETRSLEALGQADDDRVHAGCGSDECLAVALGHREVDLAQVRPDRGHIDPGLDVQGAVRRGDALVHLAEELDPLPPLLRVGLLALDHQLRRRAVLEELELVTHGRAVAEHRREDRGDPAHAPEARLGVADRRQVRDLVREERHRLLTRPGPAGNEHVAHDLGIRIPGMQFARLR